MQLSFFSVQRSQTNYGHFTDLSECGSSHSRRWGRVGSPAHSEASELSERLGHTDVETSTDTENTVCHSVSTKELQHLS